VISGLLPQLEEGGYTITAGVLSLWQGERDRDALAAGANAQGRIVLRAILVVVNWLVRVRFKKMCMCSIMRSGRSFAASFVEAKTAALLNIFDL
jgi:hypothetical protein